MTAVTPHKNRQINSNNPEQDVWHYISDFESEYFVKNFLQRRINSKFGGFPFSILEGKKQAHNSIRSNPQVDSLMPLQVRDITNDLLEEITNNARQAKDFYQTSKQMPMLSRPIILHYVFEKLASMLILSTYRIIGTTFSHGLTYKRTIIEVQPCGLFPRFHDCYSFDPSIYAKKYQFKVEDLVTTGRISYEGLVDLIINQKIDSNRIIEEQTKNTVPLHEVDRAFLLIFGLSTLARYKVNQWNETIAGKKDDLIRNIDRYMSSIQILFPNMILNQLYSENLLFYQTPRLGSDILE
jgi:hypothetical protein